MESYFYFFKEADKKQLKDHMEGGPMRLCLSNSVMLSHLVTPTFIIGESSIWRTIQSNNVV